MEENLILFAHIIDIIIFYVIEIKSYSLIKIYHGEYLTLSYVY